MNYLSLAMENIPLSATILFTLVVIFTIWQFLRAAHKSPKALTVILLLAIIQSFLGLKGFYQVTNTTPPRFLLLVGPGVLLAILLVATKPGGRFLDSLDTKSLTLLHTARLPVEIVLYLIFIAGLIPESMTFEGRNFDILSGISTPFIYYFVFISKSKGKNLLLIWNIICLVLLANIVTIAVLSAKTPFQQLAFDQPNIGITIFPILLLPSLVVPLVLISHLAAIRQILAYKRRA